jgi:hypothetical protein
MNLKTITYDVADVTATLDLINYNFDQLLANGYGAAGNVGAAGTAGAVGTQGVQGVAGPTGPTGPAGDASPHVGVEWLNDTTTVAGSNIMVPRHSTVGEKGVATSHATNGGFNYVVSSNALETTVDPVGGSGATVEVTGISGGPISTYSIISSGSGYSAGDVLTVVGGSGTAKITIDTVATLASVTIGDDSPVANNEKTQLSVGRNMINFDSNIRLTVPGSANYAEFIQGVDRLDISFNSSASSTLITLLGDEIKFKDSADSDEFASFDSSGIAFKKNVIIDATVTFSDTLRLGINNSASAGDVLVSANDYGLLKWVPQNSLGANVPIGTTVPIISSLYSSTNFDRIDAAISATDLTSVAGTGIGDYAGWYLCHGYSWYSSRGVLTSTLLAGGTGYGTASTDEFSTTVLPVGGAGATVKLDTIAGGVFSAYTIVNAGSGYTAGDILTVVKAGGADGTITITAVDAVGEVAYTTPEVSSKTFTDNGTQLQETYTTLLSGSKINVTANVSGSTDITTVLDSTPELRKLGDSNNTTGSHIDVNVVKLPHIIYLGTDNVLSWKYTDISESPFLGNHSPLYLDSEPGDLTLAQACTSFQGGNGTTVTAKTVQVYFLTNSNYLGSTMIWIADGILAPPGWYVEDDQGSAEKIGYWKGAMWDLALSGTCNFD